MIGRADGEPPWRSASALVFVDDLDDPVPSPEDAHHLRRVLRLRRGSPVCLSDGRDAVRLGVIGDAGEIVEVGPTVAIPPVLDPVTVGVVPPKGERLEWLAGRLCELGVDRILLLESDRSVVRWDDVRWSRAADRLARTIRATAGQCRRPRWPLVDRGSLGDLLHRGVPIADLHGRLPTVSDAALLVGPEGGWSDAERAAAERSGGAVCLAADVLRVETAAVAAASALAVARLARSRA